MGWQNSSSIEGLQRTKGMRKKNFVTFSHTPTRLPRPIPLLAPSTEGSYLLQLKTKKSENI
jgi:hypothetical protein